jgi:hypothetical protein
MSTFLHHTFNTAKPPNFYSPAIFADGPGAGWARLGGVQHDLEASQALREVILKFLVDAIAIPGHGGLCDVAGYGVMERQAAGASECTARYARVNFCCLGCRMNPKAFNRLDLRLFRATATALVMMETRCFDGGDEVCK